MEIISFLVVICCFLALFEAWINYGLLPKNYKQKHK